MTVFRNNGQWDASNVWYEHGSICRYDKRERLPQMRYIDWGLTALKADVLKQWPAETLSIWQMFIPICRAVASLPATRLRRAFYEIGSMEGLRETEELLRTQSGTPFARDHDM